MNWRKDMVTFLIESGADLYVHDYDDLTSMDHARESGHQDTLSLLATWYQHEDVAQSKSITTT